jgi:glycosyltransferase involved in cell wall biosynthesis
MEKEFGYPLRFKMSPMKATALQPDGTQKPYHTGMVAKADIRHIVRRMEQIYHGYDRALRLGKKGAEHIAKNFTWDKAGERFMEILERRHREWKRKGKAA